MAFSAKFNFFPPVKTLAQGPTTKKHRGKLPGEQTCIKHTNLIGSPGGTHARFLNFSSTQTFKWPPGNYLFPRGKILLGVAGFKTRNTAGGFGASSSSTRIGPRHKRNFSNPIFVAIFTRAAKKISGKWGSFPSTFFSPTGILKQHLGALTLPQKNALVRAELIPSTVVSYAGARVRENFGAFLEPQGGRPPYFFKGHTHMCALLRPNLFAPRAS